LQHKLPQEEEHQASTTKSETKRNSSGNIDIREKASNRKIIADDNDKNAE